MKFILPIIALTAAVMAPISATAQNKNDNVSSQNLPQKFWEANLPGGSYMVSLARISSIGMSTYHVKGAVVHEVDIETMGAALTRFYVIEALGENNSSNAASNLISRAKQLGSEAGGKVGVDPDTTVHKDYPLTTHSKTIEFRVIDTDDLGEIYKSISKAWKENKGRKITIK
ncbi:hypothetical protein [Rubritalea profundi]|uniref:Uncharacterized protein n=1 Tax=Rubritalea profundi TaxID=1658618 RepID=A0A2S7U590_9BACT|nr:hypothetical protein [Rubritalea profundi]PQJ29492.1 hypothetical protein BSZ32_13990 [Rubritalea profundi]